MLFKYSYYHSPILLYQAYFVICHCRPLYRRWHRQRQTVNEKFTASRSVPEIMRYRYLYVSWIRIGYALLTRQFMQVASTDILIQTKKALLFLLPLPPLIYFCCLPVCECTTFLKIKVNVLILENQRVMGVQKMVVCE